MSKKFVKKSSKYRPKIQFVKKFVRKICQKICRKFCQKIRQKIQQGPFVSHESGFLEAPLVRQADGELKNIHITAYNGARTVHIVCSFKRHLFNFTIPAYFLNT